MTVFGWDALSTLAHPWVGQSGQGAPIRTLHRHLGALYAPLWRATSFCSPQGGQLRWASGGLRRWGGKYSPKKSVIWPLVTNTSICMAIKTYRKYNQKIFKIFKNEVQFQKMWFNSAICTPFSISTHLRKVSESLDAGFLNSTHGEWRFFKPPLI